MIGQIVSHYKIIEKLGQGGMGVVYKAEDTTLDRLVALKFLPSHLAASVQDKARFRQEAKAAPALNHPNVCSIIEIADHEGQTFIVMEFVDGQTLREKQGQVSFKQAVEIAIQIAEGLAAAHDKGIVHRDIKPENIMIRKDGIAQVMDFGLAKLRSGDSTISRLTREGSTVGTAGYMSPEQVQGHDIDHRSDIFSYGVLVYELLTGQLPFRGTHEMALAYEIVNVDPPPMSAVKPDIDPALDAIVLECLEKDVNERAQGMKQIAVDLKRYKRESTRQRVSRVTAQRPAYMQSQQTQAMPSSDAGKAAAKRSLLQPRILNGIFALIALAAIAYHAYTLPKPEEKQVLRSSLLAPAHSVYDITWGGHIAMSPDGKTVAFIAADTLGVNHLWVRPIHTLTATMLTGTDEARYPFWSPDSRKIAFFARGKMSNIEATGGPVLTICDAGDGRGGSWNQNGIIIFTQGPTEPLSKVAAAGGTPKQITRFDTVRHESSHRWPMFLPDGNHFIYSTLTALGSASDADVLIFSALDSSVNKVLINATSNTCYTNGNLLFIRQATLMAQPFDPAKGEFIGDAVPVAEQIIYSPNYARAPFSASQTGLLVFQTGENQVSRVALFDAAGARTHLVADVNATGPRLSPDGKRVVFSVLDQLSRNGDVWINELARGASTRLTFNPALELNPVWSPRGDSVAFQSNRNGVYDLFIKSVNGTGDDIPLVLSDRNKGVTDWSLDGKYLVYVTNGDPRTKSDLWILPMTGERKPIPFLHSEFNEANGTFSPDSRWVAYQSDETGRPEIYARRLDGTGGKFQISTDGGRRPYWRADMRKLYFSSMDRRLRIASLNVGPSTITVDSIHTFWDYESRNIPGNALNDVSYDGKQFVAVVTDSKFSAPPITLVVNWDEELKKK